MLSDQREIRFIITLSFFQIMIHKYKNLEKRIIWANYFVSNRICSWTVQFLFSLFPVISYIVSHMVKINATINKLCDPLLLLRGQLGHIQMVIRQIKIDLPWFAGEPTTIF